jgi:hypothetical protein
MQLGRALSLRSEVCLDALLFDVCNDHLQGGQVAVNVTDDGNCLHVRHLNPLASRTE